MTTDRINRPSHYTTHPSGMECIEIARLLPGALSHAITYIWRAGLKIDVAEDDRAMSDLGGLDLHFHYGDQSALAAHYSAAIDIGKALYWVRDYIANPMPVLYPQRIAARIARVASAEPDAHRRVALCALELVMHTHSDERHVLAHELAEKLAEWKTEHERAAAEMLRQHQGAA